MDNSDYSRNRHSQHLGVNKIGRSIKKSPLHQPSFANPARDQPQPQVYNINKNDFRNIVQQLTGSPSHHSQEPPLPRPPPVNSRKPSSMRLQRIRPPPLTPLSVNRPRMPMPQMPPQYPPRGAVPFNSNLVRPPHYGQPPPQAAAAPPPPDHTGWANTAESPISAYMRYLQHSISDSAQGHPQSHPHQFQPPPQSQSQTQNHLQQSSGLRPYPPMPPVPPLPSPRMNGGRPLPSPRFNGGPPPPLPSPRMNGGPPPPLPSPTSQFLLSSPSGYLNLLSPRSPYPLLSPGYQRPPPLTPNFSFSPMAQSGGILGPGPQPPPSPGMNFPLSPGFFQMTSPRWRD